MYCLLQIIAIVTDPFVVVRIQALQSPLFVLVIQFSFCLHKANEMPFLSLGPLANAQSLFGVPYVPQIGLHVLVLYLSNRRQLLQGIQALLLLKKLRKITGIKIQPSVIVSIIRQQIQPSTIQFRIKGIALDSQPYLTLISLLYHTQSGMDIYDQWKLYKQRIQKQILSFNQGIKQANLELVKKSKDNAKNYYLKFVDLLKCQSRSDQIAFKQTLDDFAGEIKKMGEYVKNNQGQMNQSKKVLNNNEAKTDKDNLSNKIGEAIVREKPDVKWDDVAGLFKAKDALKQAVIMPLRFPQIFTGSRKPWKGILLYGPPGTGKTFLAKACASEMEGSTFFSISSSDIMSKYVGEAEKMVKTLFETARRQTSSVIFIDEVDSMTGNRGDGENESSRRVKTQFLVQMEGVGKEGNRVLVLGATNLPWELDPAIRRRFERRIYIPLPQLETRLSLLMKLCAKTPNTLTQQQFRDLAQRTQMYSGSDIKTLVKDAVYEPLRISQKANKFRRTKNQKGQPAWVPVPPSENIPGAEYCNCKLNALEGKLVLPDLQYKHFVTSLIKVKPSVDQKQLANYQQFTKQYGQEG